jgi:hypothetical protein
MSEKKNPNVRKEKSECQKSEYPNKVGLKIRMSEKKNPNVRNPNIRTR